MSTQSWADLTKRARRIGMHYWPYGMDREADAQQMLDWAAWRGLRYSSRCRHCMHWLVKGRCGVSICRDRNDHPWLDHVTAWTRDGRAAVLVAHPYGICSDAVADIAALVADTGVQPIIHGGGWYGHGTAHLELWAPGVDQSVRFSPERGNGK